MSPKNFTKQPVELEPDLSLPEIEKPSKPEVKENLPNKETEISVKETEENFQALEKKAKPSFSPADKKSIGATQAKNQVLLEIENILEEDLEDVYFQMDENLREDFKTKGEQTAVKIEEILSKTKINTKKIFKLIFEWLKMVPKVSKFFIKQETKIKTDKILKLKS